MFALGYAFSRLEATLSLDRSFFAFASDVSARKTRFHLCEQRFRWVNAFPPLRATFALQKRVFALTSDVFAR